MVRCCVLAAGCFLFGSLGVLAAELEPETIAAWETYVEFTEARIDMELESAAGFLAMDFFDAADRASCRGRIESGEVCVLKLVTIDDEGKEIPVPKGMVHHWYGAVFVPGARLEQVLAFVQRYDDSKKLYPEVEDSRLLERRDNVFEIFLRLKRQKVLTVHYNTDHEVTYRDHGDGHASSRSLATRIREIVNPGKKNESERPFGDDRGFLWGLNSYWRFEETSGGTIVECESVSLSRSIPAAAEWLVKSFLDSVPRESLESTLAPIRENLSLSTIQ